MADWVAWLVAAGVLLVAEVLTLTFVLGLFGVAALLAALGAVLGLPLPAQVALFAVAAGVLWLVVRPLERLHRREPTPTNADAMAGRTAVVTEEVTAHAGRVTLGGESWAARTTAGGPLPAGSYVSVAQVDGATLVVLPEES